MDAAAIQWILTGLLFPVLGAGFWLTQKRLDQVERHNEAKRLEIWTAVDEQRKALADYRVQAEQRFASTGAIRDLKNDLDKRLDRIDGKLDELRRTGGSD